MLIYIYIYIFFTFPHAKGIGIPLTSLCSPATTSLTSIHVYELQCILQTSSVPLHHQYPKLLSTFTAREMNPEHHIPIRSTTPENPRLKRHHSASYYVHRVKDNLTTRVSKLVCAIFLSLLFIIGIITFILWLSLRPHRPRFHIRQLSIPGLTQENGFDNARVIFNVTARNANQNMGIYYDAMQVSLYYRDQDIGGTSLLNPFYQQPKNTTILYGELSGPSLKVNGDRWAQFMADREKGSVPFRLEATSTIRFKISTWSSKHHKMHATCEVGVGPDGLILSTFKDKRCPVYFT